MGYGGRSKGSELWSSGASEVPLGASALQSTAGKPVIVQPLHSTGEEAEACTVDNWLAEATQSLWQGQNSNLG